MSPVLSPAHAAGDRLRGREVGVRRWGEATVRVLRLPGPADGPTFVLVHGAGLSSRYLQPLARLLAAHGDVVLLDLPASRGLPAPPSVLSVAEQAALVDAVARECGAEDPVLVGQSMGAQVVVETLARWPRRYGRAVLVGPPVNAAERTLPRQVQRYLQTALREPGRMVLLAARAYLATTTRWLVDVVPVMLAYPIEDRIGEVTPAGRLTLVRGEHDHLAPRHWCEELLARSGAPATLRTVAGAAHTVVVDHAAQVAAAAVDLAATARPHTAPHSPQVQPRCEASAVGGRP